MSTDPGLKARVDSLLEQVFGGVLPVSSAVRMLLDERSTRGPGGVVFCAQVAQTVLDEIRYVAKYPFNDLRIAAELTGHLIKHSFIASSHLAVILEAARRPVTSKLFRFAVVVIEQLLDKIVRFPLFCAELLSVSEFKLTFPRYTSFIASTLDAMPVALRAREVLDDVDVAKLKLPPLPDKYEAPLAEREAAASAAGEAGMLSRQRRLAQASTPTVVEPVAPAPARVHEQVTSNQSVELILSEESLLTGVVVPSGSVQDQVSAIFNSLSTVNTAEKAGELRQVLQLGHGDFVGWIALYMTKNRILKEANLHNAYLSFLQMLNHVKFYESMTNATYACLKLLLGHAELAITSSQHRTAVKNLGSWLGMITIARDKPLRSKDLDLKQILIDAFESGKLSVIIPLVCKVLQACGSSKAYRPPNAWTSGILAVLAEIHDVEGLKTNLVFEIEVLGQTLNVNLRDFRRPIATLAGKRPPDDSNDFVKRTADTRLITGPVAPALPTTGGPAGTTGVRLPVLLPPVTPLIAPSIVLFQMQPKLKPLVGIALERAIKEVVVGVIDRSVNIAVLTTKELVLKDFFGEKDKTLVITTAGNTAATLASSLALVTCKEPLKTAISQHLKQCLTGTTAASATGAAPEDSGLIEQVVQIVTQDNLEIAGAIVERVVVERAVREVEVQVKLVLESVQESAYVGLQWLAALPNQIKAKSGNLGVYAEFSGPAALVAPAALIPPPAPVTLNVMPPGVVGGFVPPPPPPPVPPPPAPPVANAPPPPAAAVAAGAGAVPAGGPQTHAVLQSLKEAAESVEGSAELVRLMYKLSVELEELSRELASSEGVVTLPEVVESQPVYLDAYYALIGTEESGKWLSWLREVFSLLQKNKTLCAVVVHFFVKAMVERFEIFAAAIAQENFGCHVTQQHIWFELALATLSLVATTFGPAESGSSAATTVLYGPMYALLVYTWHGNLGGMAENAAEAVKQVYMYLGIGLVRYGLVKEGEFDKLAVRLFTDFRSIPCTMFVLNFLYLLICKLRMSPISAWSFSMEVISKLGLRVRETGLVNIPLQERPLAERLELFMREGKAVSNLAVDRVMAYRHLHCITVNGPQQLPAELVEFQALRVDWPLSVAGLGHCLRLNSPEKRQVVMSLIDQYRLASEEKRKTFWQSLKAAGMQFDSTSLEWSEAVFAAAVFRAIQPVTSGSGAAAGDMAESVDWVGGFALSLARDAFGEAGGAGDGPKFRVFRKALEAVGKVLTEASLAEGSVGTWRETQTAWGVPAGGGGVEVERVCMRMLVVLYGVFVNYRGDSGMWISGITGQYVKVLMQIQPRILPRFTLCYVEIIGHREFLPRILNIRGQRGWLAYAKLLQAALGILEGESMTRGLLRILLVLLHDFPEFLANYQAVLVGVLPRSAVQMRNLILSAFPKNLKLPDPFQPGLVMRFLPEAKFPGRLLLMSSSGITGRAELEQIVRNMYVGQNVSAITPGLVRGCVAQMDEVVHKVCVEWPAGEKIRAALEGSEVRSVVEVVCEIVGGLDREGRYLWISSMTNYLRYPSSETLYFSELLISIFLTKGGLAEAERRETILRVLLERLIVHRPHPWGLLVTFVTLVRDTGFWEAVGNSMSPEVEKIFNTVAATCLGAPPVMLPIRQNT